jgi:DNA-directed RNA polymerase subunit RPC12/RpoP
MSSSKMQIMKCNKCNDEFAIKSSDKNHNKGQCDDCSEGYQVYVRDYGDREKQREPGRLDLV